MTESSFGNDEIQNISSVVSNLFDSISVEESSRAARTMDVWRKVLLGIKSANPNEGRNLAGHSRICDLKNGVLFIDVDHPGWIELLQLRKSFILRGIQMYAPELKVQTLAFRVGGKRGDVTGESYSASSVRESIARQIEKDEQSISQASENSVYSQKTAVQSAKPLAPELADVFAQLGKDMGITK